MGLHGLEQGYLYLYIQKLVHTDMLDCSVNSQSRYTTFHDKSKQREVFSAVTSEHGAVARKYNRALTSSYVATQRGEG
jgi:hypothetical protein